MQNILLKIVTCLLPSSVALCAQTKIDPSQISFVNEVEISTDPSLGNGSLSSKLTNADVKYSGQNVTFAIRQPGTISTSVTLGNGHSLYIASPLSWNGSAQITLAGNNVVNCGGPTAHINISTGLSAFVTAAGAANIAVHGCYITSTIGTNAAFLLDGSAGSTHLLVDDCQSTSMGFIGSLTGTTDDVIFSNNYAINAQYAAYFTANATHITGTNNHFVNGGNGIELFGAVGASGNPSLAVITGAGNPGFFTFTDNTCSNVIACIWTSTSHDGVIGHNIAQGCSDVCFDAEGSAYVTFDGNTASGATNFEYSTFYSAYYVRFINNLAHCSSETCFRIKFTGGIGAYGTQYEEITGNQFICDAPAGCPAGLVFEGNQWTTFARNHLINVGITDTGNVSVGLKLIDNIIDWYVTTNAGFIIPSDLNGPVDFISGNVITSYVTQKAGTPALQIDSADYNNNDTYSLDSNKIQGSWPVDMLLQNNGGNVPATYLLRNNTLTSNVINTGGSNGVNITGHGQNNCSMTNACY